MAIHQLKKQSDLEKRLQLLRRQVYNKTDISTPALQGQAPLISSEITYLYKDLLKIGILSGLAIGTQVILFFLLKNNILRINFI